MDDQPELGRPNYSASASRPLPSPAASTGPDHEEPRIPIRAVLAAFCALLPWGWTLYLVRVPMLVPFLLALIALRLGRRAWSESASRAETAIAVAAMLAATVFLFIELAATFGLLFVEHHGFGKIIEFYIHTP